MFGLCKRIVAALALMYFGAWVLSRSPMQAHILVSFPDEEGDITAFSATVDMGWSLRRRPFSKAGRACGRTHFWMLARSSEEAHRSLRALGTIRSFSAPDDEEAA